MCYNQFVRGGEPVCDHDASLRRWMQRSRMLTALASKQLVTQASHFLLPLFYSKIKLVIIFLYARSNC